MFVSPRKIDHKFLNYLILVNNKEQLIGITNYFCSDLDGTLLSYKKVSVWIYYLEIARYQRQNFGVILVSC